jgi:hypothetical protein
MSDLIAGRAAERFRGLAACGGFSYGDVLGAGRGWATSILERPALREQFAAFFARPDTFALGVCNGCQMMSQLKDIIPGAEHWPRSCATAASSSRRALACWRSSSRRRSCCRHGRLAHAGGGGARRRPRRVRHAADQRRRAGGAALRRRRRPRGQPPTR